MAAIGATPATLTTFHLTTLRRFSSLRISLSPLSPRLLHASHNLRRPENVAAHGFRSLFFPWILHALPPARSVHALADDGAGGSSAKKGKGQGKGKAEEVTKTMTMTTEKKKVSVEPKYSKAARRCLLVLEDDHLRRWREEEDLNRALALSLAEDFKRPRGYPWRTNNDDDIARGPRDRLHRPLYPSYVPSYPLHSTVPYYPRVQRICSGCNRDIGRGKYLGCMGTFFHPECFCCRSCGYTITEREFSLSGRDPYHKTCFKEFTHPKCGVCHQFIPANAAGLIEYRCHPFWAQKYCPSHEHDNTARCCSCERLESRTAKYIALGDGRSLCLECLESAIMDTGDCQPLYHAIRDFYEGMNMRIDQQIPMLLVEREALNEAIVGEKNVHHMPETRGLCLSEEQTVTSILRRPRIGGHRLVGMRTHPQRLTRICEVTAILVIYGLPRLLTGTILAHELMHGWLRLKGFRNLSPEVEEGICQVLGHMWLESEVMPGFSRMPSTSTASSSSSSSSSKKGRTSEVEKKLGEFFLHQIANDTSPAYGDGFRTANAAVNKYGLRSTLDHIRLTGSFPL